jgi:dienelactone hydrolase
VTTRVEKTVTFQSEDGVVIGGIVSPGAESGGPGVVLVPDSRHERDVYGTMAAELQGRGVTALRIDVRGRGASRGDVAYAHMGPLQRQRVALDVKGALNHLVAREEIDPDRLAVVAERDTAADAMTGGAGRVRAAVVLGAHPHSRLTTALAAAPTSVLGLVSADDRTGVRGTVDAYLAGTEDGSRLVVMHRQGFGATMLSTVPGREGPLENLIGAWLAARLGAAGGPDAPPGPA